MSKRVKIWLLAAASLILVGCMIFVGVMTVLKWDFGKLSTDKYETNRCEISEPYQNISVKVGTADVVFVPTEGTECYVECYEQEKLQHSVSVKDGTLTVEVVDTRKWYDHIAFNLETERVTVYLPAGEYGALSVKGRTGDVQIPKDFAFESIDLAVSTGDVECYASADGAVEIKATTGDICVGDLSVGSLTLSVSTGKVTATGITCADAVKVSVSTGKTSLTDIACKSLSSNGSTGGIRLQNVIASEAFRIERGTGDVTLDGCDAAEILIETDTGDVTGTLLSEKVFDVHTDTGKKEVPSSTAGGSCRITTDTGDIRISVGR